MSFEDLKSMKKTSKTSSMDDDMVKLIKDTIENTLLKLLKNFRITAEPDIDEKASKRKKQKGGDRQEKKKTARVKFKAEFTNEKKEYVGKIPNGRQGPYLAYTAEYKDEHKRQHLELGNAYAKRFGKEKINYTQTKNGKGFRGFNVPQLVDGEWDGKTFQQVLSKKKKNQQQVKIPLFLTSAKFQSGEWTKLKDRDFDKWTKMKDDYTKKEDKRILQEWKVFRSKHKDQYNRFIELGGEDPTLKKKKNVSKKTENKINYTEFTDNIVDDAVDGEEEMDFMDTDNIQHDSFRDQF
jgi:hypothetical protein